MTRQENWHYIESQEDVDFLLKQTYSFHDTVLKDLKYVSGSYVDDNKAMKCVDTEKRVTMCFDSQLCRSIELVFEGVVALNLRPHPDNCFSGIFCASVLLNNASMFFCDTKLDSADKSYEGTWIESHSLRWRFYD